MMRAQRAGPHTLVGAYVMDAVPERDRVVFERHVQGCEQCRDDIRGLREATARLGAAAALQPRPKLREHTIQAAARLRQLPPVSASERTGSRGQAWLNRRGRLAWRGSSRWFAWPGGIARPWLVRLGVLTAAAAVIAAIVLGLHLGSMQDRLTAAQQRNTAIAAILSAGDEATVTAEINTGGSAKVMMSHRAGALVFVANGLARLPGSKAYELWLMGPAGARPAGMLPPAHGSMSGPMLVNHLQPGDHLALTIEPAAGSRQPTSTPIVMVTLGA